MVPVMKTARVTQALYVLVVFAKRKLVWENSVVPAMKTARVTQGLNVWMVFVKRKLVIQEKSVVPAMKTVRVTQALYVLMVFVKLFSNNKVYIPLFQILTLW